jgi:NAD(P)-dependent dehydrogenase (short-subunit alcohol dehydrogenase family)
MKATSEPLWKHPRTVLITGATGGIGSALALAYSSPHRTLILHGRDQGRLSVLCERCKELDAQVIGVTFDLRDSRAAIEALREISQRACPDLVIVNAGITRMIGRGEEGESFEAAHDVLAVNLEGALATIAGVLPEMRRRGCGQIALMSSLAAYYGLPRTPAYSASKAALKVYGEALRAWLAPQGIGVSVILPGFVDTPMTDSLRGPKPSTMPAERAALLIRRGLESNRARIAFPRLLAWGMPWLTVMPAPVVERIMGALGFGGRRRRSGTPSAHPGSKD